MKVKELIKALSQCNGDAEVIMHHPEGDNLLFVCPLQDKSKVFLEDLSDIDAKHLINERYKINGTNEEEIATKLISANFDLLTIGFPYETIKECLKDEKQIDYLNYAYAQWWNENRTVKFNSWTPSFDKEKWLAKPINDRELAIVADSNIDNNEYLYDFISSSSIFGIKMRFIDVPEEKNNGHIGVIKVEVVRRLTGNLYTALDADIKEDDAAKSINVYFNTDEYPDCYNDPFTFMDVAFEGIGININTACENTKYTFHGYVLDINEYE